MVDLFKSVFDEEMFADLYYVEDNPASVRTINVSKIDGHVVVDEELKTFQLKKITDENKTLELKHNFFVKLNFTCTPKEIKYFGVGIIGRLLGRRKPKRIVEIITEFDWVIVTKDILDELRKTNELRDAKSGELVDDETELRPVGNLMGVNIHLIPEDITTTHGCKGIIYGGYRKSITPVIHRFDELYTFETQVEPGLKKFSML